MKKGKRMRLQRELRECGDYKVAHSLCLGGIAVFDDVGGHCGGGCHSDNSHAGGYCTHGFHLYFCLCHQVLCTCGAEGLGDGGGGAFAA